MRDLAHSFWLKFRLNSLEIFTWNLIIRRHKSIENKLTELYKKSLLYNNNNQEEISSFIKAKLIDETLSEENNEVSKDSPISEILLKD